jgi:hypothetical protein
VDDQRERLWSPVLAVGAVVVTVVAFFSLIFLNLETCGGDGGLPYAAPASPRGEFCSYGGQFAPMLAPLVALVVGSAVANAFRRRSYLVITLLLALFLAIAPHLLANRLSKECAGDPAVPDDQEFRDNYDCQHF